MLLDDLDDNWRACGFCATPILEKDTFKFSDVVLEFLELCLDVKGTSLPLRVCKTCFEATKQAKAFKDKCIRSFTKLKSNGVSSSLIWGRSSEDRKYLKYKFDGIGSPPKGAKAKKGYVYEDVDFSPPLEYNKSLYKVVKPRVDISVAEKELANAKVQVTQSGRFVKKKNYFDDDWGGDDWTGDWNSNVKGEPVIPQKTEDEVDAELSDCGETFPAKGPYQCEICQNITQMKKHFVAHIKDNHMKMIDAKVLRTLEADLVKRQKKICAKLGKKYVNPNKKPTKPKPKPKPKKKKPKSDGETTSEDEDEYIPAKKKSKIDNRGMDAEGNPFVLPEGMKGTDPGVCPICGKTISRMNELGKHQRTAACRKIQREKGIEPKESPDDPDYGGPKKSMKKRYEDEEKFDPGDYDEDFDDAAAGGGGGDADDAIQAAVKASLETARQELSGNETSSTDPTAKVDSYIDPAPQPDVVQNGVKPVANEWDESQCAMETVVTTTQPISRPWGTGDAMDNMETDVAAASIAANPNGLQTPVWNNFPFYQQ